MKHKTTDVFGVKSRLIKSYIERESVDSKFQSAIKDGNEVIVYGSSKQGKTSLILKHLGENDYVKVECSPQTKPIDIYKSILRQLGVCFIESEVSSTAYEHGGNINGGFKIKVPLLGDVGIEAEVADTATKGCEKTERYVEYNLALAQDVSEILKTQERELYVVLENFHYLEIEVQETLAYDLRVFQDHNIIFIVLGIWREANRLIQFNGDLLDRISEVPVEPWETNDFRKVITKGSELLNVNFSQVEDQLINDSFDSIGVVQEICKNCCLNAGVNETQGSTVLIKQEHLDAALKKKSEEYGVRHIRNFEAFVDIARKTSNQSGKPSLAFPYYFIRLLLTHSFDEIEKGLSRATLLEEIRKIHHRPEDVRSGDLGAFLHNITQHQINKKIQPPFVDYDRGGKILKLIDSSLYFFLKHCDRGEILSDIPNPVDE
ncbi:MAG: ATP-binding protein [Methylobacter sp.]|uniref:ATP-binding protein n=1 Tax=Methylobacter sp. TaxID=2051955 RepID=UPI00258C1340|nr:ATP-binding protein [Methylobacter sp.]MCL7422003.1 ATP-binding protein [Methylobacter sp.]